jgi:predicted DNA-binding transcriptional regulator YafY
MEYAAESLQGGPLLGDAVNALRKRFEPLFEAQRIKPHAFRDRIRILSMGGRRTDPAVFKTLAEAILRKKRVSVRHRRLRDDTLVQRTLSPYRLVRYRDNWYLDGYCHLRDRLRELAVSRIEAAEPAPGRFHSVPKAELEAFFADAYGIFTGKATATARIVFTGVAAREVSKERWHPRQHGEWLPDGSYRLSIPYGDPRELIMDVLRWGSAARVTAPKKLRDQVRRTLKESLDLYDTGRVSRSESEEGYTTTDGRTDLYKGADEHGTVSG